MLSLGRARPLAARAQTSYSSTTTSATPSLVARVGTPCISTRRSIPLPPTARGGYPANTMYPATFPSPEADLESLGADSEQGPFPELRAQGGLRVAEAPGSYQPNLFRR